MTSPLRYQNNEAPCISVIVPACNPGKYLRETIDSIIAQTFSDWDCIVVDDGSTEDLSWVDAVHPKVRRLRQDNRGLSIARNAGILNSTGEFLAFVDADDVWRPNKLQSQIQLLQANPNVAFCHTAIEVIDGDGTVLGRGFAEDTPGYVGLLSNSGVCVSSVVVRRHCLAAAGLFDPLLRATQDYDMWLKLTRYYNLSFVPEPCVLYRIHANNMSGNPELMADEVTQILLRHIKASKQNNNKEAYQAAYHTMRNSRLGWGSAAFGKSRLNLRDRDYGSLRRNLTVSFKLAPLYTLKSSIRYLISRYLLRR